MAPRNACAWQVWKALASVLHMSNLVFDKVDDEQGEIAAISDRAVSTWYCTIIFRVEGYDTSAAHDALLVVVVVSACLLRPRRFI